MTAAELIDKISKVCTSMEDEIVYKLENRKELFKFGGWNLFDTPYMFIDSTIRPNKFVNIASYSLDFIADGLLGRKGNWKGWYLLRDFLIGDYYYCPYDDEIKIYKKEIPCVKERFGYYEDSRRVKQSEVKSFVVVEVSSKSKRRRYGTKFKEFRHKNPQRFNQSWYLGWEIEIEE